MFINVMWNWKTTFVLFVLCIIGTYAELCELHSTSPTCQHLRQMKLTLDDTVDPCEDFYGYACNNWRLAHPGSLYHDVKGILDYQTNLQLIAALDEVDPQTLPLKILNETLVYYKSCLNAGNSNALRAYLEVIKPGEDLEWPVLQELEAFEKGKRHFSLDEWPDENFDHFTLIGKLWNYGLTNILLHFSATRDTSFILKSFIEVPYLLKVKVFTEDIILNLLTDLGLPQPMALDYTNRIKATHDYWCTQAQLREEMPQYNTNYGELKKKFPYFNKILRNIQVYHFNDNDTILIQNEQYLKFLLEHQKQQLSPEEKRNLCDYIMFMFLWQQRRPPAVGESFKKLECVKEIREELDLPVHLLYYEYIYRQEEMHTNADVQILYQKTRDYLQLLAPKYLVGYNEVLQELKEHINRTALNMGNMPRSLFSSYFDKLYGDLPNMLANKYYCNQFNLLVHHNVLRLKDLTRTHYIGPNVDFTWVPSYDHASKMMILSLVTLQPPIYHHAFDAIFKWSSLAYLFVDAFRRSPVYARAIPHQFNEMSSVEVAYQGYVNEQKSKLQPDFTNIPWKKLFLINLAQFYCRGNNTDIYYKKYSHFVISIAFKFEHFAEAFQCGDRRVKPYCSK